MTDLHLIYSKKNSKVTYGKHKRSVWCRILFDSLRSHQLKSFKSPKYRENIDKSGKSELNHFDLFSSILNPSDLHVIYSFRTKNAVTHSSIKSNLTIKKASERCNNFSPKSFPLTDTCDCDDCQDAEQPCAHDCVVDNQCEACFERAIERSEIEFEIDSVWGRQ